MVRVAGVEPALLSEQDFESSASTNSTTPAHSPRRLKAEAAAVSLAHAVRARKREPTPSLRKPRIKKGPAITGEP